MGATLSRFRILLLRDPTSLSLVQSLSIGHTPAYTTADLAFLHQPATEESAVELLSTYGLPNGKPVLGVTLINWGVQYPPFTAQLRYEQALSDAIRHFVTVYDGHAMLFAQVCGPTQADDDRVPARRIHSLLAAQKLSPKVHFVNEELTPSLLQAAYGQMDLFIGSRLHSNIFALTQEVPVLAIAYQDKTIGVMRMLGLEEWAMRIEHVDSAALIKLMDELWRQREPVAHRISEAVTQLHEQSSAAIDRIADDYAEYMGRSS